MDGERFDSLTKTLGDRSGTRRRALRLLGVALGAAVLPDHAEALTAKARHRCRRKGGVPLEKGNCHCAQGCDYSPGATFPCQNNPNCHCSETVAGHGLCVDDTAGSGATCSSNEDCPTGELCTVLPGCAYSIPCTMDTDCDFPSLYRCVRGLCQETSCDVPCPT